MTTKQRNLEIRAAAAQPGQPDSRSRVVRFVGATENVARDGGILKLSGWDLDGYRGNPVFLWAHDQKQPPVGRAVNLRRTDSGLEFDIEFPPAEVYPFGELVGRLYEAGYMKAVSVGFRVMRERAPTSAERSLGAEWVSEEHELLELSAVPVGADASALKAARMTEDDLVLARSMGLAPKMDARAEVTTPADAPVEGERPYDASGKKIKDPTPEEIAAYEEEKKKKHDREIAVDQVVARLDAILQRLEQLFGPEDETPPPEGMPDDAAVDHAGASPSPATSQRAEQDAVNPDTYDILAKAAAYAGRRLKP